MVNIEDFKKAMNEWYWGLDECNNTDDKTFNDMLKKYGLTLKDMLKKYGLTLKDIGVK